VASEGQGLSVETRYLGQQADAPVETPMADGIATDSAPILVSVLASAGRGRKSPDRIIGERIP